MENAMDPDTPYRPVIRSQSDLEAVWRRLMGPLGFGGESVWWLFVLPDGRAVPRIVEITECTRLPDHEERANAAHAVGLIAEELTHDLSDDPTTADGLRVAFLRARPGRGSVLPEDRVWAHALHDIARRAGLACETVHLATDETIRPLPLDELGAA